MKHVKTMSRASGAFPKPADMAAYKQCLKADWYGDPNTCKTLK